MCSIINKPLTFGCVCVYMRASFLHGIHELLQTFSRDPVCSLNDEVELVQAPDNAHGRCQADGGQCLDCVSSPRRVSWISGKLHRVSQKERCLRRDQKQIPEWNRQDSLWVPSKHSKLIRQFQLMCRLTVILKSDCLLRHRQWQSSNVFIQYWSLAALPNGWEIQFSFYLIAKPAPFTEYIWAPHMTGSERCDWPAKCQSVCFSSSCRRPCGRSAVLGHHRHRRGRRFAHRDVLFLHREEMLLQEEEEQEGQEGEGRHGNEEPERRRGKFHQWGPHRWHGYLQPVLIKKRKTRANARVFLRLLCNRLQSSSV